jgi:acyl-CoA thioesterase FadM
MVMKYTIHSEQRNALVADGETVIVMYDYAKGEKAPIPEEIRAAVLRIEARETDALRVGFNQPERPAGA